MGLFKLLRYAYGNRLVKHDAITTPPGVMTPIAVDLWNVMYTLLERFCGDAPGGVGDAAATARCFLSLLRMLLKRSYYPIFVADRGIHGDRRATRGAKAIVAQTMRAVGGSGRLGRLVSDDYTSEDEVLGAYEYPAPRADAAAGADDGGEEAAREFAGRASAGAARANAPRLAHRVCVSLIRFLGYAYVDAAETEADDVCANLFHTNAVAHVYTTDTDMILMGCDMILDAAPLFPPTLRCRDVLASLGLTYGQFLAAFVCCHTDLHQPPMLRSVQQVVRGLRRAAAAEPATDTEAEEGSGREREPGPRPRLPPAVDDPLKTTTPATVEAHSVRMKYTSRHPPIAQTCADALRLLPASQTRGGVLERKFVKHVVDTIAPRTRGRWAVLKRVPIAQEAPDPRLVYDTIVGAVGSAAEADTLMGLFWKHIPAPPPFARVLADYWDEAPAGPGPRRPARQ
ncbi:virion host shutoff factor [Bubaline alphaherpesvirus 1]|uniref:Virion host shutoff protein n=1 Tax=Bubaline alphaherpesvirus 1 TaxID=202910 RepID=A0A1L5JKF0_9ALPH|nr:virion host shutoff factor [Bubaline alphaherpesvirus 1]APO15874.1 virion host shutoff factor [Bubaline alphaherpesvirus 1]WPD94476.1 UL41 [Bubaline alphaherpesvirus 1]